MAQDSNTTTTWIIVIVVIIIIIALGWWYFAQQNAATTVTTTPSPSAQVQSSAKYIMSFSFSGLTPAVSATIDNTNYTVTATVPKGTDLTKLTPTITVSDNATVVPASGTQQDFTNPVTYTVTAQDGSTQQYTVTVKAASK